MSEQQPGGLEDWSGRLRALKELAQTVEQNMHRVTLYGAADRLRDSWQRLFRQIVELEALRLTTTKDFRVISKYISSNGGAATAVFNGMACS